MLNFAKVRNKEITLAELCRELTVHDLHRLTDEMIDTQIGLIAEAVDADVVFVPIDPEANDSYAENSEEVNLAWTLGHVIVHATASSEETAAQAANLARGVAVAGRMRYETPWETVRTIEQVRSRLEESRRIRHAFLNTWPDQPHMENTYTPNYPYAKPRNPIVQFVSGLSHDDAHLEQIKDILRQAGAVRAAG
jgi:hypothetical protein